jgi:hypothetical protein
MGGKASALDSKLTAVLARLCERLGSLTKTQAVKLPYLVDVVGQHFLGERLTRATYQTWKHGVVAAEVWHFAKSAGHVGAFKIEEEPYSEGSVSIRLAGSPLGGLSPEEQKIVDYVADQYGHANFEELGRMTKAMNVETRRWGSNSLANIDDDAYARLVGHWSEVLSTLAHCDTEDEQGWTEVTEHSPEFFRKSFGA